MPQNSTMPALFSPRQPGAGRDWFDTMLGRALLASEAGAVQQALAERRGQPWLWLTPQPPQPEACAGHAGFGLCLSIAPDPESRGWNEPGWYGRLRCRWPLPIASEALATVVVQHIGDLTDDAMPLIEECARVLVPGGRLWLLALNPLTPYRRHWAGSGLVAVEPFSWRRRLRNAGLSPEAVSSGLGPRWRVDESPIRQHGAGLRAAYLLRAHKRVAAPIPPARVRALRWQPGLPAA